jgi:hypothetical protein
VQEVLKETNEIRNIFKGKLLKWYILSITFFYEGVAPSKKISQPCKYHKKLRKLSI